MILGHRQNKGKQMTNCINSFSLVKTQTMVEKRDVKFYPILFVISTLCVTPLRIFTYIQTLPNTFRLFFTFVALASFFLGVIFSPRKVRTPLFTLFVASFAFCSINWYGQWRESITYFEKMYADYLFFLPVLLSVFYLSWDNIKIKKRVFGFVFVLECVTLITTIYGLQIYPNASRDLASEAASIPIYKQMNIGGYDFIYGLVLLIPTLVFMLGKKRHVVLLLPLFFSVLLCIFISQYSIALIITIVSLSIFILFKIQSKPLRFSLLFLALLLMLTLIGFSDIVFSSLGDFMYKVGADAIGKKLYDLASSLGSNLFVGTVESRLHQYSLSFTTIIKSPLFGRLINDSYRCGGHSELLDIWATGGVGALVLFTYILKKCYSRFRQGGLNRKSINYLNLTFFVFVFIALTNTVLNSPLIAINAFLLPSLIMEKSMPEDGNENTVDHECFVG